MEFPTTNLYELESRVFTDHWSIPYKREESLGKCLVAATCLAKHGKRERVSVWGLFVVVGFVTCNCWMLFTHYFTPSCQSITTVSLTFSLSGLADADENCKQFMDRCMHEAFKKVICVYA